MQDDFLRRAQRAHLTKEIETLFDVFRKLKTRGIVYIPHRMPELCGTVDRVTMVLDRKADKRARERHAQIMDRPKEVPALQLRRNCWPA